MYRTQFLSKDLDKVAYYKKYSNTLNKLKWICKSSYYKQQFELNKTNLKNTWKFIGTIINRKPRGHTVPAKLHYNGNTYTDKHDIVNQFNEYFINIGPNLASTIHSSIKPDAFLPATHSSSFFLSPVLGHFLTLNTLKQIYYSLIYPYLHYGIMSWGNTYPSRLTKVQIKQNKCIRCIFFSHNRESSAPYLKLLDILNTDSIFKLKISLLAHKISQRI